MDLNGIRMPKLKLIEKVFKPPSWNPLQVERMARASHADLINAMFDLIFRLFFDVVK